MDIRETCACGATFSIDIEHGKKIDESIRQALADWRSGHTHMGGGAAAKVASF